MLAFLAVKKRKMKYYNLKILEPKLAILDETDSGLDIDASKNCS